MLRTQGHLRLLGPADLPAVTALLARDPVVNVVADYRSRITRLDPRWMGGEMWGWSEQGRLVSLCHAAANLMPVMATPAAVQGFAERAARQGRRCSTILGPSDAVEPLWDRLSAVWPAPRSVRRGQRYLALDRPCDLPADPLVRRSTMSELDVVYPASVAMYTEEVGVSPEHNGGRAAYRARVSQLIARGWSFVRIEGGRVVFKAEVAAATGHACQIQDVFVAPDRRGEGLGTAGMAAVVEIALAEIAPVVALYVNGDNLRAQRVYEKIGFRPVTTFTTILF